MNVEQVKECSSQLKILLHERHNALDAGVKQKLEEIVGQLDAVVESGDWDKAISALSLIASLIRIATNVSELISSLG